MLRQLPGQRFDRIPFRGLDAVVIRVPDDAPEPPPAVAARHAERGPMRLYPVEGAHMVKWPYTGGPVPDGCAVEPGGWDHEHCDACNGHINTGTSFWQTADEPCRWLCPDCHSALVQLPDAEPGAAPDPART